MSFVISYDYPGTTNGLPVGRVYVTRPHFGKGIYSHTYKVSEAAAMSEDEAVRLLQRHRCNNGTVLPREAANDLPTREQVAAMREP